MAEEHDSFMREVREEMREERIRALWNRFGPIVIGGAVALVIGTAGYQGYSYWMEKKAQGIGDTMYSALQLAGDGKYDAAVIELDKVEQSDFGGYPGLAQLRKATILGEKGDRKGEVERLDAIALDKKNPEVLQNIARIRAAYVLVDTGSLQDVEARVKPMATDIDPMRLAAREALGLAAWKAGKSAEAAQYFQKIVDDNDGASTGFHQRATLLLDLMKRRGEAAES